MLSNNDLRKDKKSKSNRIVKKKNKNRRNLSIWKEKEEISNKEV